MTRPPVLPEHGRKVVPRQADAAEKVDLEVPQPILVANLGEGLRLVDAQVVHEDVRLGNPLDEVPGPFRGGQIGLDIMDGAGH